MIKTNKPLLTIVLLLLDIAKPNWAHPLAVIHVLKPCCLMGNYTEHLFCFLVSSLCSSSRDNRDVWARVCQRSPACVFCWSKVKSQLSVNSTHYHVTLCMMALYLALCVPASMITEICLHLCLDWPSRNCILKPSRRNVTGGYVAASCTLANAAIEKKEWWCRLQPFLIKCLFIID